MYKCPVLTALFLHLQGSYCSPVFLSSEIRLIHGRDQTSYPLLQCSSLCNLSVEVSHLCASFLLFRNVRWSWMTRRVIAATLWTATFSATHATWRTSSRAAPLPSPPLPPINITIGGGRHLVDKWKNCPGVTDSRSACTILVVEDWLMRCQIMFDVFFHMNVNGDSITPQDFWPNNEVL